MDPDETLRQLRVLSVRLLRSEPDSAPEVDAVRLAELVSAMDSWLTAGGFLPQPWRHT